MVKRYHLFWSSTSLGRSVGRGVQLECPDPIVAGKIQSAQRASIAPVEWSYVEVLDPNTEIGRVSLELPKMELKYQKSEHGPARPNSSRSVSLTVGDAGTQIVEEKIGAYLAVYAVTLERGFLRAEIIYDDKNVYVAGFHK